MVAVFALKCKSDSNPFLEHAGKGKILFSSPKFPDWIWDPPSLLLNGYCGTLRGTKRPGREVHQSSPSNAQVKRDQLHTSTSLTCDGCEERDKFVFRPSPSLVFFRTTSIISTYQ